jgi:hypothetical protein
MPFLLLHVVLAFALDLVHALTRSERDRVLELVPCGNLIPFEHRPHAASR